MKKWKHDDDSANISLYFIAVQHEEMQRKITVNVLQSHLYAHMGWKMFCERHLNHKCWTVAVLYQTMWHIYFLTFFTKFDAQKRNFNLKHQGKQCIKWHILNWCIFRFSPNILSQNQYIKSFKIPNDNFDTNKNDKY